MRPLAVLAIASLVSTAAAGKEDRRSVEVDTVKGSHIQGTTSLEAVSIDSELGSLEVPVAKIERLRRTPSGIALMTTRGDKVVGQITGPDLRIESDLGSLTIPWDRVELVEFLTAGDRPPGARPAADKPAAEGDDEKPAPSTERAARPSPIPRSILRPSATRVTRQKAPTRFPVRKLSQNAPK